MRQLPSQASHRYIPQHPVNNESRYRSDRRFLTLLSCATREELQPQQTDKRGSKEAFVPSAIPYVHHAPNTNHFSLSSCPRQLYQRASISSDNASSDRLSAVNIIAHVVSNAMKDSNLRQTSCTHNWTGMPYEVLVILPMVMTIAGVGARSTPHL